ncbi:MAG: Holliday junction branch migration protein RuvA [Pseudomonadota bacterium]
MIGRLSGILAHRGEDSVLIDVRGVGYVVQVSARTAAGLPPVGQAVSLWTELLVREDLLQLMGFETLQEKEWYRLLITVQGVGAKAAMAILGTLAPGALARALALGDATAIRAAPGVGPKLAQRVVLELKDKAPVVMAMGAGAAAAPAPAGSGAGVSGADVSGAVPDPVAAPAPPSDSAAIAEALSALVNLGYAQGEAAAAVALAGSEPGQTTAALIRAALKRLAPKS